jgi:hypothetical protein
MIIMVAQYENATVALRVQLGVGASPNEVAITDSLIKFNSTTAAPEYKGDFFAMIPAGSRISARGRAVGAGYKAKVGAYLLEVN